MKKDVEMSFSSMYFGLKKFNGNKRVAKKIAKDLLCRENNSCSAKMSNIEKNVDLQISLQRLRLLLLVDIL